MKYVENSFGSAYVPKLLGIYERELNAALYAIFAKNPDTLIDVGAAEGYYAVGIARLLKQTKVIAFESEEQAHILLRRMALLNGSPQNLQIRGWCGTGELNAALADAGRAVILMDVEGHEDVLLDPTLVPALNATEIIAEMHDFLRPGVTERIISRFRHTHTISRIEQEPRQLSDFPYSSVMLRILPKRYVHWAVAEHRPVHMHWLHCVPVE